MMASDKIQKANRERRVAKALRANLKRRKAQARTRGATAEEQALAAAAEKSVKEEGKTN